jgi:hypothetical protein
MSRWRAAGMHLLISAGIAAGVLAVMVAVWYPPPLFQAMGGVTLALILIGVDVVLGPALTLIVFRSGKPRLKLDLAVIALVQVAALLYGCHVVALARPAFIVFVKDQFQVATAAQLAPDLLAEARHAEFREPPWTGPQWVYGEWPSDRADQDRLLMVAFSGADLQHFPKHYAPYAQGKAEILARAQPLSQVRKTEPAMAKAIDEWVARAGVPEQALRYLPLRGREAWVAVLIHPVSAEPLKLLLGEDI